MNPEKEWEVERARAVLLQPFCWLTLRITARDATTCYAVATVSAGLRWRTNPVSQKQRQANGHVCGGNDGERPNLKTQQKGSAAAM